MRLRDGKWLTGTERDASVIYHPFQNNVGLVCYFLLLFFRLIFLLDQEFTMKISRNQLKSTEIN